MVRNYVLAFALPFIVMACGTYQEESEVLNHATNNYICKSLQHNITPYEYRLTQNLILKVVEKQNHKEVASLSAVDKKKVLAILGGRQVELYYDARSGTGNGLFIYKLLDDGKLYLKHDGHGDRIPMDCSLGNLPPLPKTDKPVQFVALAFDGSKSLDAWERTRDFAKRMQNKGIRVRFSYYINAAYFLANSQKGRYMSPKKGSGASAIGFGGSPADVAARIVQVEKALAEGHDVGSHAVGHFNAAEEKWSEADWNQEFSEFNKIMTHVFEFNGLPVRPLGYSTKTFVGFRAPELGVTSGLYPVLKKFGYRYDTSRVASSTYWPEKINGIWNFPLAEIRMAHTGRMTLSMDYNFYVAHSRAQDDLSRTSEFEEDMYQSYMNYFMQNYNGNRAPVHIGHHFSMWNGGAYWRAMARFAETVCGKPEVFCGTYKELADWLDSLPDSVLQAYRRKGSAASSLELVSASSGQGLLDTEEILRRGYALPPANEE